MCVWLFWTIKKISIFCCWWSFWYSKLFLLAKYLSALCLHLLFGVVLEGCCYLAYLFKLSADIKVFWLVFLQLSEKIVPANSFNIFLIFVDIINKILSFLSLYFFHEFFYIFDFNINSCKYFFLEDFFFQRLAWFFLFIETLWGWWSKAFFCFVDKSLFISRS